LPLKTLQIAILGGDENAVLVGLKNFPSHKLTLISVKEDLETASRLAGKLVNALRLDVEILRIKDAAMTTMMETVGQVLRKESENFEDFLINVGSAGKHLTCAGVTAAFVNGVKAIDVMGDQPIVLPILKLSYAQIVSGPKLEILQGIASAGGEVEGLDRLGKLTNFGKPLLSYHIRGSEEGKGLVTLGLVEVKQLKQGKLKISLTALGRILLAATPNAQPLTALESAVIDTPSAKEPSNS